MRIAYITADHGVPVFGRKGASIHVQEMVHAYVALEHTVTVFTGRKGGSEEGFEADLVKVKPSVPDPDDAIDAQPRAKLIAKETRSKEIGELVENALIEEHSRTPFDFIYERYSLWSAAGVRAAARLGIPCFMEVNAPLLLEQEKYRDLIQTEQAAALEAEVFGKAHAIAAVSEQVRDYAIEKGAAAERCHVVPNGVDTARFHPDVAPVTGLGIPDDAFVVGFVGSLKAWHGLEPLLDGFRELPAEDGYHLLIVGEGPLRTWVEGYVRGARLDGRVTVSGWVDYVDIPSYVRRFDVAAAPYHAIDDFYFSPLKLFEYLAIGRPVVASAIGQLCDVIEHGRTGLLATPDDPADFAAKVAELHRDVALRERISQAAAIEGARRTWMHNAQKMIELATEHVAAA
jgi:glycosyltransferase involved in cell wall biosynthesis